MSGSVISLVVVSLPEVGENASELLMGDLLDTHVIYLLKQRYKAHERGALLVLLSRVFSN